MSSNFPNAFGREIIFLTLEYGKIFSFLDFYLIQENSAHSDFQILIFRFLTGLECLQFSRNCRNRNFCQSPFKLNNLQFTFLGCSRRDDWLQNYNLKKALGVNFIGNVYSKHFMTRLIKTEHLFQEFKCWNSLLTSLQVSLSSSFVDSSKGYLSRLQPPGAMQSPG